MTAALDGDFNAVFSRKRQCERHVRAGCGPHNNCRATIVKPVPDFA